MKLRVGLVGLGPAWERHHRPALRALSDRYEVKAVCEQVALRARNTADEFDATAVDGFRALAARPDVDAILILSPQWFGALPILAACDASKAVYCAAALDLDPATAELVRTRVESSGIAFMAEFPRRHAPATLRLKELIATRLGPVKLVFCHQRLVIKSEGSNGVLRQFTASPMLREMIELVDWCRFVVGRDPASVVSVAHQSDQRQREDYRMLSLEFPSLHEPSAIAQISCGRYLPVEWQEAISFRAPTGMQVCCERGVAFVDLPTRLVWFDEAGRHQESLDSDRPVGEQLLANFHRAVTSLLRRTDDLQDAYQALQIVTAAKESSRSGKRIALDP